MATVNWRKQEITSETGLRWFRSSGPWADQPIRTNPRRDLIGFVIREVHDVDCVIDPRDIVGMAHGLYNQGMTWREFLRGGKRIAKKLEQIETAPEYYDDPRGYQTLAKEPWVLTEIDGNLYVDGGNHRSVIAKFRAHVEGRTSQLVWRVDRLTISKEAQREYEKLQQCYYAGESDEGAERILVKEEGGVCEYRIEVWINLNTWFATYKERVPIDRAVTYVQQHNRFPRWLMSLYFTACNWLDRNK